MKQNINWWMLTVSIRNLLEENDLEEWTTYFVNVVIKIWLTDAPDV